MERLHDELVKLFNNDKSYNTNVGLSFTNNKYYRDLSEYASEVVAYKQTGFIVKKSYLVMDRGIFVDNMFYILVGARSIEKQGKGYRINYRDEHTYYEIDDETGGNLIKMLEIYKRFEQLGDQYAYGQGVSKDHEKALYYYGQTIGMDYRNEKRKYWLSSVGAERYRDKKYLYAYAYCLKGMTYNDVYSYYYLGVMHQYGLDMPKDLNKAIDYYKEGLKINATHPDLCYQLGQAYYSLKRYDECFEVLNDSSDKRSAYNLLGILYNNGYGCPRDIHKTKEYYIKAAGTGNKTGFYNLALLAKCEGNPEDYLHYVKKCQEVGANWYVLLAYGYHYGFGYEKDLDKAIEYYNRSINSKLNVYSACYWLSKLYFEEYKDYENAYKYAMKCYEDQGVECNRLLALMYAKGIYVEKDPLKALELLKEGAKANDAECLYELGLYYLDSKDLKEKEAGYECLKWAVYRENVGTEAFDAYVQCIHDGMFKIDTLKEFLNHLKVLLHVYEFRGKIVEEAFLKLERLYVSEFAKLHHIEKTYEQSHEFNKKVAICMPMYSGYVYDCMLSLETLEVYRVLKEYVEVNENNELASKYKVYLDSNPIEARVMSEQAIMSFEIKNIFNDMEKDGRMQKIMEEAVAEIEEKYKNNE